MVKIQAKVGLFTYWISEKKGQFRIEGLRDNGDWLTPSEAVGKIALARSKYPKLTFKIEAA
jgi:hypothetical protein